MQIPENDLGEQLYMVFVNVSKNLTYMKGFLFPPK